MKIVLIAVAVLLGLIALAAVVQIATYKSALISAEVEIEAPADQVYHWATSPDKLPAWVGGLESSQPIGSAINIKGARSRETVVENGRRIVMESQIMDMIPNKLMVVQIDMIEGPDLEVLATYRFNESNGQTRVHVEQVVSYHQLWLKALAAVMDPQAQKHLQSDLARLKAAVEGNHKSQPAAG